MIEDLWQHVREANSFRRVSETHPLDLYVGLSTNMERTLLLRLDREPPTPSPLRRLKISKVAVDRGQWSLMISVLNAADNPIFNALCTDLVAFTKEADVTAPADELVLRRLARWKSLLQGQGSGLSDQELRGLCAELIVLLEILIPRLGPPAVTTWAGPLGAPQDFDLGDVFWEVKATHGNSAALTINSLEQLASPSRLYLACVRLDQGQDSGLTVPNLVARLREVLEPHSIHAEVFETRLAAVGYEPTERYDHVRFHFNGMTWFEVRAGFPRITPDMVPTGVTGVSYKINLGALREYATEVPRVGS